MLDKWEVFNAYLSNYSYSTDDWITPLTEKQLSEVLVNTVVSITRYDKCIFSIIN